MEFLLSVDLVAMSLCFCCGAISCLALYSDIMAIVLVAVAPTLCPLMYCINCHFLLFIVMSKNQVHISIGCMFPENSIVKTTSDSGRVSGLKVL